jgi:5,10-methylenetetrahydrofolate reductase
MGRPKVVINGTAPDYIEQIEELKKKDGVKGVHIMAIGCEERISEIIEEAGLLPRPDISK